MCSAKTVTFGGVVSYPAKQPAAAAAAAAVVAAEQTKARFNCIGTLRDSLKMVGTNGSKLLTVRLVRSKLRKREESAAAAAAAANNNNNNAATAANNGAVGPAANAATAVLQVNRCNNNNNNVDCQQQQQPHGQNAADAVPDAVDAPVPLPFLWQYSAKNAAAKNNANGGYNSSPYRLFSTDQDTLVCSVPIEETAEHRKGLRKNLRGKWRRLVHKKQQQQDAYKIPAELRDQLKQIYVY